MIQLTHCYHHNKIKMFIVDLSKGSMTTNPRGDHWEGVPVVPLQQRHHGHGLVTKSRSKLKMHWALTLQCSQDSNRDQCLMETMCDCDVNKLTWLRHDRVVYENTRQVPFVTHFYDKISKKIVPFSRPASTSSVFYLDYWSFRLNFPRKFGSLSSKLNNKLWGVNGDKPSSVDCI